MGSLLSITMSVPWDPLNTLALPTIKWYVGKKKELFLSTFCRFCPPSLLHAVCKASSETESCSTHLILLVLQLFKSSFILPLLLVSHSVFIWLVIWVQNSWLNTSFQWWTTLNLLCCYCCAGPFQPILGIFLPLFKKRLQRRGHNAWKNFFGFLLNHKVHKWNLRPSLPLTSSPETASVQITDFCFWKMGSCVKENVEPQGFWRSKLASWSDVDIEVLALQKNVIRSPRK